MSYQSREVHKFFWAIKFCNYKTYGFQNIFAFCEKILHFREIFAFCIFAKFCFVFASCIFAKKCEISRESLRNATEHFRTFWRNVSFTGNPLVPTFFLIAAVIRKQSLFISSRSRNKWLCVCIYTGLPTKNETVKTT